MKIIDRRDDYKGYVQLGDTFHMIHNGKVVLKKTITEAMTIDTLLIIEPEKGELGLEKGIGGIFGQKEKNE